MLPISYSMSLNDAQAWTSTVLSMHQVPVGIRIIPASEDLVKLLRDIRETLAIRPQYRPRNHFQCT